MQSFINYLITEYRDKATNYAAIDTKFTHSSTIKIDKKSNVPLKNNIIKVTLTFYDKSMNKLYSSAISFENNLLPKPQAKKLVNISPKELENKFMSAKNEVCDEILNELLNKRNELNEKINDIAQYKGVKGIIPDQFKGESISVTDNEVTPTKPKMHYDM